MQEPKARRARMLIQCFCIQFEQKARSRQIDAGAHFFSSRVTHDWNSQPASTVLDTFIKAGSKRWWGPDLDRISVAGAWWCPPPPTHWHWHTVVWQRLWALDGTEGSSKRWGLLLSLCQTPSSAVFVRFAACWHQWQSRCHSTVDIWTLAALIVAVDRYCQLSAEIVISCSSIWSQCLRNVRKSPVCVASG